MITLLSDFGHQDAYAAVMKGVIAAIAPAEITCDLTHELAPQDILAARFNLKMAYPYFPNATVHLVVVDPGVGTARRAIAVRCVKAGKHCFLVGPDNGVLSGVIEDFMTGSEAGNVTAVSLTNPRYWRSGSPDAPPSYTFHGRDIFAPVAAHLASGVPLETLGDRIDPHSLEKSSLPSFHLVAPNSPSNGINIQDSAYKARSSSEAVREDRDIRGVGCIQHVDRFGNLISNIPEYVIANTAWKILLETPAETLSLLSIKTYSDAPVGSVTALVGSHGWIEIACNGKSAAAALEMYGGVSVGAIVKVEFSAQ